MQLLRLPLALAVVVFMGACAPSAPVTAPSPERAPAAGPAPATDPSTPSTPSIDTEVDPEADPLERPADDNMAPSGAPARWWLADADAAAPGAVVERAYRELLAGRQLTVR